MGTASVQIVADLPTFLSLLKKERCSRVDITVFAVWFSEQRDVLRKLEPDCLNVLANCVGIPEAQEGKRIELPRYQLMAMRQTPSPAYIEKSDPYQKVLQTLCSILAKKIERVCGNPPLILIK